MLYDVMTSSLMSKKVDFVWRNDLAPYSDGSLFVGTGDVEA